MIRVAVSPRAYRAIKATLPEGAVVLKPDRDSRGRYLLMLDEGTVNGLNVRRRIRESISDVIIRLRRRAGSNQSAPHVMVIRAARRQRK